MAALIQVEKKLIAFALFTIAMKVGPASFKTVESISEKIGIEEEIAFYAKDLIHYPESKKENRTVKEDLESLLWMELFESLDTWSKSTKSSQDTKLKIEKLKSKWKLEKRS